MSGVFSLWSTSFLYGKGQLTHFLICCLEVLLLHQSSKCPFFFIPFLLLFFVRHFLLFSFSKQLPVVFLQRSFVANSATAGMVNKTFLCSFKPKYKFFRFGNGLSLLLNLFYNLSSTFLPSPPSEAGSGRWERTCQKARGASGRREMAVSAGHGRKARAGQLTHYYEGYLEKKAPWEKDYKKFWAGLRGLTLYFYNTSRDVQYVDLLDLADFVSLVDDNPPRTVTAWCIEGAKLTIRMRSQEVKLKMESLESREMWKGFILTMVEMQVPSSLALLPGHIYMLSEALEKEREQRLKTDLPDSLEGFPSPKITEGSFPPAGEALEAKHPDCFFRVSRTEAEVLLEKNKSCGNMLLRPGRDGKSISVTTRQVVNGTAILKHYKINQVGKQYIIDVEDPYCCSSLAGVVEFFVKTSKHTLIPLQLDDSYAETLEFVWTDNENGETTQTVLKPARLPDIALRAAGPEQLQKPLLPPRSQPPATPPPPPPVPPAQTPPASMPENEYMVEDKPEQTYMNPEDEAEIRQTKTLRGKGQPPPGGTRASWTAGSTPPKVPPVPPSKPPKPDISAAMTPSDLTSCCRAQKPPDVWPTPLAMSLPRGFSVGMSKELEKKLQKRRATLELSEANISS